MAIFKSKTVPGRLVVCLDLKGTNGVNIVVPVELDVRKGRMEVNILTSVYSRKNKQGEIQQEWFDDNFFKEKNSVYLNKEKVAKFYQSAGLQLPMEGRRLNDLFGFSIKTEEDLVKLKNQNTAM